MYTQNEQTFFKKLKRKRVLLKPKLGELPVIYNFYKEECSGEGIFGAGLYMFFFNLKS